MVLLSMAVARQWLIIDHAVTITDTNVKIALKQGNGVFYAVRAEML
jgi:hypothetical protein